MTVNLEELEEILENDNHTILNKTYSKIKSDKNDILQKLNISTDKLKDISNKLKDYRYIDEISDIVSEIFIFPMNPPFSNFISLLSKLIHLQ